MEIGVGPSVIIVDEGMARSLTSTTVQQGAYAFIFDQRVIAGTFSHFIPQATAETVIEANYQITVNRWLSVTPAMQYIIRPSGSSAISNALVLGTQLAMNF